MHRTSIPSRNQITERSWIPSICSSCILRRRLTNDVSPANYPFMQHGLHVPRTRNPRANAGGMGGHAEQRHHHHAPALRTVQYFSSGGGSRATACSTSAPSSRFTLVVRRLPGNGVKGIGETESPWISSTIATSGHREIDTRPPCGLEALESTTDR